METTEKSPIQISGNGLNHLSETRRWTMFISIIGLMFIGMCVITIPVLLTVSQGYFSIVAALPVMLMAIVYIFPVYYLLKFSLDSRKALLNADSSSFETSLRFLKLHYRFMGILLIAFIIIYFVVGVVLAFTRFF